MTRRVPVTRREEEERRRLRRERRLDEMQVRASRLIGVNRLQNESLKSGHICVGARFDAGTDD